MPFTFRRERPQQAQRPGLFSYVALVSAALYAKEQWDEYRARKAAQGGISLQGEGGLPAYQEIPGEDDLDSRSLRDGLGAPIINADGTHARSGRPKRKKSCCVCFGIPFDIICKALGIVTLGYLLYGIYSLISWASTPYPTPDHLRPDFNSSIALGCPKAPFQTIYRIDSVPSASLASFLMKKPSTMSGTLTFVKSNDPAHWEFNLVARASTASGLDALIKAPPTTSDGMINWTPPQLAAPSDVDCLRYDLTIGVPTDASARLKVDVQPVTHVRFDASLSDPNTPHPLAELDITLRSGSGPWLMAPRYPRTTDEGVDVPSVQKAMSLLELSPGIMAMRASYVIQGRGFLSGTANILKSLNLDTAQDDALAHVTAQTYPYSGADSTVETSHNLTTSSAGLASTYTVDTHASDAESASMSPLTATHTAREDLYLTYRAPRFAGPISLQGVGTGHSFRNVQSVRGQSIGQDTYFVGHEHGLDSLHVRANKWLSIRF